MNKQANKMIDDHIFTVDFRFDSFQVPTFFPKFQVALQELWRKSQSWSSTYVECADDSSVQNLTVCEARCRMDYVLTSVSVVWLIL